MKSKTLRSSVLKGVAKVAESSLRRDANQTTCVGIYQPSAPKALEKFSKIKK